MKRLALLFAFTIVALSPSARATYVDSGKSDFATATNTTCNPTPNAGGVTTGFAVVMAVQANSTTTVTIASSHVTSWTLDQTQMQGGGTVLTYIWHGFATSNGAESIVVNFSSGSALIGSACGEWDSTLFDTSNSANGFGGVGVAITTSHPNEDLVGFATTGVSTTPVIIAPFTQRQQISSSGSPFAALGDRRTTSAGSYTFNPSQTGASTSLVIAIYSPSVATPTRHRAQLIRFRSRAPREKSVADPDPILLARTVAKPRSVSP